MREKDTVLKTEEQQDEIELFDPYSAHFISQNKRNEFLSALEDDRSALTYSTVH